MVCLHADLLFTDLNKVEPQLQPGIYHLNRPISCMKHELVLPNNFCHWVLPSHKECVPCPIIAGLLQQCALIGNDLPKPNYQTSEYGIFSP